MTRFLPALGLVLLAATGLRADEFSDARQVIDRAIDAIGGADRVKQLRGGTWKTNGTVRGNPSQAEFHGQLPDKFRIDSMRLINGEKVRYSRIVDGDKGWVIEGDDIKPMSAAEIAGVKESFYHKQTATTLVPLTEKSVQVRLVGKSVWQNQPVTQIKVIREGFPDLLLTFSDVTWLLVKSEMNGSDARTGQQRKVEIEWSDHQPFDGIKMARRSKTFHNGELFIDTEITDFKAAGQQPRGTFEPPAK